MTDKAVDPMLAAQATDELRAGVAAKAFDGRITCAVLRGFAEQQGVPYKVAGAAADLAGVKVGDCGLGCF